MEGIFLIVLVLYHFYVSSKFAELRREIKQIKSVSILSRTADNSSVIPESNPVRINDGMDVNAGSAFAPHSVQQPNAYVMHHSQGIQNNEYQESAFYAWLKTDFLVKLGALLLLIAFGWFVSYAFANNWIGPFGRIVLGILAGLLVMILGIFRIVKQPHQGAIFTVLGSSIILLTLFAAINIYDFFTPVSVLAFMFMTVAFVALVSVQYKRERLALASLLSGAIAPLLVTTSALGMVLLFTYLLVLVLGTIWVVYRLQSGALTPVALAVVVVYGLPYLDASAYSDQLFGLLFTFIFTLIFFVTNITAILVNRAITANSAHYLTAVGTGAHLILWIMVAAPVTWQTPLYLVWMLVFALGSFVVYIKTNNRIPFYIYGSVSLSLLAAATADLFEGAVLTVMYAVELAALILLANNVVKNSLVARYLSLLYVALGFLSIQHMVFLIGDGSFSDADFFALLTVMSSLVLTGLSLVRTRPDISTDNTIQPGVALLSGAVFYLFVIVWLTLHKSMPAGVATTVSLVVYTIVGLISYVQGRLRVNKYFMTAGGIIIGGVVLRLLLIDVWSLAVSERIVVFFVVGVLLLSTAFITKKTSA